MSDEAKSNLKFKILEGKKLTRQEYLMIYSFSKEDLIEFMQISKEFVSNQLKGIISYSTNIC